MAELGFPNLSETNKPPLLIALNPFPEASRVFPSNL
jgi:hypothetical protein